MMTVTHWIKQSDPFRKWVREVRWIKSVSTMRVYSNRSTITLINSTIHLLPWPSVKFSPFESLYCLYTNQSHLIARCPSLSALQICVKILKMRKLIHDYPMIFVPLSFHEYQPKVKYSLFRGIPSITVLYFFITLPPHHFTIYSVYYKEDSSRTPTSFKSRST